MTTDSQLRSFVFTWNNYTNDNILNITLWLENNCKYYVFGYETGESGTPHIQGYCELNGRKRWKQIQKETLLPFFESRKGSAKDASNYCKKGKQSHEEWAKFKHLGPNFGVDAIFEENGTLSVQGKRSDLEAVATMVLEKASLKEIALENPGTFIKYHKGIDRFRSVTIFEERKEKPKVTWIWGKSGVGKTKYVFDNHSSIYVKDHTQWWDGYEQQEAIIIDDFEGLWPFRDLLRLLDRYPYQGQFKGGYIHINSPHIYITSEFPPKHYYFDEQNDNHFKQIERRIDLFLPM